MPVRPPAESYPRGILFRNANIGYYGDRIARSHAARLGKLSLKVAIVGCGGVGDAWSMMSAMESAEIGCSINAFDNDPAVLANTDRALPHSRMALEAICRSSTAYSRRCLEYFKSEDTWTKLNGTLLSKITYSLLDIVEQPLPAGHDVVVMNHVLQHHWWQESSIMDHVVAGLNDGGMLICNDTLSNPSLHGFVRCEDYRIQRAQITSLDAGQSDGCQFYDYRAVAAAT